MKYDEKLADVGRELSQQFDYNGVNLLKVLYYALEDANYHRENEVVGAMLAALDVDADCEFAVLSVPLPNRPTKGRYFRDLRTKQQRTVRTDEMANYLLSLPTLFQEISYIEWLEGIGVQS